MTEPYRMIMFALFVLIENRLQNVSYHCIILYKTKNGTFKVKFALCEVSVQHQAQCSCTDLFIVWTHSEAEKRVQKYNAMDFYTQL